MRYKRTMDTRYIPTGSMKVCDKASDAIAYLYTNGRGKPTMIVYFGKQSSPVAHYNYKTDAEREAAVKRWFETRQAHDNAVAERVAAHKAPRTAKAKFEVGRTYYDRSSCDWDTIYSFKITDRTAKTLTIEEYGKSYKRGLWVGDDGVERCKPHGTYSMCSLINAERSASP